MLIRNHCDSTLHHLHGSGINVNEVCDVCKARCVRWILFSRLSCRRCSYGSLLFSVWLCSWGMKLSWCQPHSCTLFSGALWKNKACSQTRPGALLPALSFSLRAKESQRPTGHDAMAELKCHTEGKRGGKKEKKRKELGWWWCWGGGGHPVAHRKVRYLVNWSDGASKLFLSSQAVFQTWHEMFQPTTYKNPFYKKKNYLLLLMIT